MAALIVEITTRGRGQPQYRRVRQFPYRIGRGFDNDVILHDETVSAAHLQLERDHEGTIWLRNLSHENGTLYQGKKMGYVPLAVADEMDLQLGHTGIRLLNPDANVKPARLTHHYPGPLQLAGKLPLALTLLALLWLLEAWRVVDGLVVQQNQKDVWLAQLPQLLSPLLMATLTGFVSRLLLHRWQYPLQLSIACIASLMLMATIEMQSWLSYYYSSGEIAGWFYTLMLATVFTALFAWQLRAFSNLSRERAAVTAVAILWPLLLVLSLPNWLRESEFRSQPAMHTLLRASDERDQATVDIEHFVEQLDHDLHSEP